MYAKKRKREDSTYGHEIVVRMLVKIVASVLGLFVVIVEVRVEDEKSSALLDLRKVVGG